MEDNKKSLIESECQILAYSIALLGHLAFGINLMQDFHTTKV
jgi:hypothetical protein